MTEKVRIQKIIASAGLASRRVSEKMVFDGRVKVNGVVVTEPGLKVDAEKDIIEVDGNLLPKMEEKTYYLLNKPTGYITTMSDPQGRKTVKDLMTGINQRVYPVGRLDYDTSGLLLLTNDGYLANALAHPGKEIEKRYQARVNGVPSAGRLNKLRNGVLLDDGMTYPAKVRIIKILKNSSWVEISIHEGRNRQVRRMFESVGHRVIKLIRVRIGNLTMRGLKPGKIRKLTIDEVNNLRAVVGES